MPESSEVSQNAQALATEYNNLRKDVLDTSLGHVHDGTNGRLTGAIFTELAGQEEKTVSSADTWEDWDLSGIIGVGATAVLLLIEAGGSAMQTYGCRKNGSALARLTRAPYSDSSADRTGVTIICECDASRIIEIYAGHTSAPRFGILGYWR